MSNTILGSARKRVPEIASLSIIVIACLALGGWGMDNLVLRSVVPTLPPMRPNAIIGLLLGATSLWLFAGHGLSPSLRKLGGVCALLVLGLGLGTLIQYLFDVNLGMDGWLFKPKLGTVELKGRMPISTALSFLLSGAALLTMHA